MTYGSSSESELVQEAELHEADVHEADDQEADVHDAEDQEAELHDADDQEAELQDAELQEALDHEAAFQAGALRTAPSSLRSQSCRWPRSGEARRSGSAVSGRLLP